MSLADSYLHRNSIGVPSRCLRRPVAPTADEVLEAHARAFPTAPRPVSWQAALRELVAAAQEARHAQ